MILAIVLAVYAVYAAVEFRSLSGNKKPGVLWTCLVFFGIGLAVQALYELKINVPSPARPISAFISSMFNLK
jgi:hypothetical protein